ncbi:MAG: ABC transporter permease subunit, partial [Gammaproteobacteria bacterium]
MNHDNVFRRFSIGAIWLWIVLFALVPNFLVFITSLLEQGDNELIRLQLSFNSYLALFDTLYAKIFVRSFLLAGTCTLLCLFIGYPFAYALSRMPEHTKGFLLLLVIIPFWTSSLIRSYAIIAILKTNGLLNKALLWLGLIDQPLHLMYTGTAVMIGLVYSLLPFMILPLYANIEKLDARLLDAAHDLGANKFQMFFRIILPLTIPGIMAGSML